MLHSFIKMVTILLTILGKFLLGFLVFIVFYAVTAFLLTMIPINGQFSHSKDGVTIWVISDGIHADFILPVKETRHDWWKILDAADYGAPKEDIQYMGFGWGDKGFYMEIPTWSDLTLKIAAKAVLIPSPTCMHVTAFSAFPEKKYISPIQLTDVQYKELCNYILKYFTYDQHGQVERIPEYGFSAMDCFYEAKGSYHCFNTCNYWVSRGLKKIGVKSPIWSPFARGIFYQLNKVDA